MSATAATKQFTVELDHPAPPKIISASYFKADGEFIAFKDDNHQVVFYVRADSVLAITCEPAEPRKGVFPLPEQDTPIPRLSLRTGQPKPGR